MSERACERRATSERAQSVWASERASERKASKRGARASAERASAERDGIARHDEHPNTTMRSARDAAPARSFTATASTAPPRRATLPPAKRSTWSQQKTTTNKTDRPLYSGAPQSTTPSDRWCVVVK